MDTSDQVGHTLLGTPYWAHHTGHTLLGTPYWAHHTGHTILGTPYWAHLTGHNLHTAVILNQTDKEQLRDVNLQNLQAL